MREAVRILLASHEPFPATVIDRGWDLVWANRPAWELFTTGVADDLLRSPTNVLRVALHPDGLMSRILNQREYATYLMGRLRREAAIAHDPRITSLYEEICRYPEIAGAIEQAAPVTMADALFVPLRLAMSNGAELSFFSSIATFGTAIDITVAELSIESYFPADDATAEKLRMLFGTR